LSGSSSVCPCLGSGLVATGGRARGPRRGAAGGRLPPAPGSSWNSAWNRSRSAAEADMANGRQCGEASMPVRVMTSG
jgi:hypothetical protein